MDERQERNPLDGPEDQQIQFVSSRCSSLVKIFKSKLFLSLLFGQALSAFICGTAVTSEYLNKTIVYPYQCCKVSSITFSSLLFMDRFLFIAFHTPVNSIIFKKLFVEIFLVAIIDVEANFMIIKAYQFTSVTSVQLIDCLTIPTVLLLSRFVFTVRFGWTHYIGVLFCLSGVGTMLTADFLGKGSLSFDGSNPILGDILVAAGASLYGVSNVAQEYLIRKRNKTDYLGWLGLFCTLICGIQMACLEGTTMSAQFIEKPILPVTLCFIGFTLSMFLLYSLMPWVMEKSSAVVVNLSLLTADIYALIVGLFVFHENFHELYYGAYVLIMIGVFTYVIRNPKLSVSDNSTNEPFETETFIK